jgi:transcriptional regulator of arginine metabolism
MRRFCILMPSRAIHPTPSRDERRARIAALVRERRIASQAELGELLAAEHIAVNQGTLSRDLRDMGLLKGPGGYELPAERGVAAGDASVALYAAVQSWLVSLVQAQNLVVLKTPIGGASPLAVALDAVGWDEVVGTVAGDDTILIVTPSNAAARRALRALEALKERKKK